ncbi:TetR/AcrR family transcriptional regulator [Chryseolinea sp. T2]|uniref:TetR/AcrR family transcriptional regulator n=1 Tax=Chryseolinea sp. T2 TaxID=3129255 RepID=UPI0030772367
MKKASRTVTKDLKPSVAEEVSEVIAKTKRRREAAGDTALPVSKSEKTKEFIRKQAAPLFNKQGFAGTSLGDLTHATGLTKGALYGNFKDKDGIALEAFAYSMHKVRDLMKSRLDPVVSNKEKLFGLLDFFGEFVMQPPIPGGCPMMNYGVEADDGQRFMRKPVAKEMQSTIDFIQLCLVKGVRSNEFKSTTDAAVVARVIFCAIEGAIVVSRVTATPAPMSAVVAHCKSVLDQLSSS